VGPLSFRFDPVFGCWALYRYAEVQAAFRDPRFAISPTPVDEAAHTWTLRNAANQLLTADRIASWRRSLADLPFEPGEDLVSSVAEPWSHAAALRLVDVLHPPDPALLELARAVFRGGADPLDAEAKAVADAAGVELSRRLPQTLGPLTVQAFVAVSQTLQAFLGAAWVSLYEHPSQMALWQDAALEELFRFAGPAKAQFRYAAESIDGVVAKGSRVALLIGEANRDPDPFGEDAGVLNLRRNASGHLAFGLGPHACLGAQLTRIAALVAMPRFLERCGAMRVDRVEWRGSAITAPQLILVA
jgi:cytochrome P450